MADRTAMLGVGAALGIAAGVAIGALLFGSVGAATDDGLTPAPAPAIAPGAGEPGGPIPELPGVPGNPHAFDRPPVESDGAGGAPATPTDRPPAPAFTGTGRISGLVVDKQGTPLADIRVRVEPYTGWPVAPAPGSVEDDPDRAEAIRRAAERWDGDHAGRTEVRTGPDGRFAVTGLADRVWSVSAHGRHMKFDAPAGSRVRPDAEVELIGTAQVPLQISVRLPDGSEPARAIVSVGKGRSRWRGQQEWTPRHRTMWVEPGTYRCSAVASRSADQPIDAPRYRSESVSVECVAGGPEASVTLELAAELGIVGILTPSPGGSLEGVRVYAAPDGDGPFSATETDGVRGGDRDGNAYSVTGLEPGVWRVGASNVRRGPIVVWKRVTVTAGLVRCDLVLPDRDPGHHLRVQVLDASDTPQRDVRFRLVYRAGGRSGVTARTLRGTVDESGVHWLALDEDKRERIQTADAADPPVLEVEVEGLGTARAPLGPSTPQPLVVRLGSAANVWLRLDGVPEDTSASVRLIAEGEDPNAGRMGGSSRGRSKSARKDGDVWRFEPMQPGSYELRVTVAAGPKIGHFPAHRETVTVRPGENEWRVAIAGLHAVTVVVDEGGENTPLQVSALSPLWGDPNHTRATGRLDADGRLRLLLPSGAYRLQRWAQPGAGQMALRLPGATEVRFARQAATGLQVAIFDRRDHWSAQGLVNGDVIVAVDGVESKGSGELSGAIAKGVAADATVQLRVWRAGTLQDVSVQARDLMGGRASGVRLTPTVVPQ